jgi:hypothetical protein
MPPFYHTLDTIKKLYYIKYITPNKENIMDKVIIGITAGLAVVATITAVGLLTGWITMVAWNYTLPYLFNFKSITYLQGCALNILGWMFFKSPQTNNNKK